MDYKGRDKSASRGVRKKNRSVQRTHNTQLAAKVRRERKEAAQAAKKKQVVEAKAETASHVEAEVSA